MADGRSMSNLRIAAALVSWVAYGLAFIPIHRLLGPSVATLNILPVVATGLLLGMWAGLIASLTAFPVSLLLLLFSGEVSWNAMTHGGGLTGSILLLLIGTAVCLLHDKVEQVKKKLAKRARAAEALKKVKRPSNSRSNACQMAVSCGTLTFLWFLGIQPLREFSDLLKRKRWASIPTN